MVAVCRANSDSGCRLIALTPSRIHEMGHFVDDEAPETEIVDHGCAFFNTSKTLSREERLHNADTYAIFAFENAFGKERVVKMFPLLR